MSTIGITGGTGFIGHHLSRLLTEQGYKVVIFTRNPLKQHDVPNVHYAYWNPYEDKFDLIYLQQVDAVVHLAGAGIADKRWTDKRKKEIYTSRVDTTKFLVSRLKEYGSNCKTLVSASAIGYYGPSQDSRHFFTENDKPAKDFLSKVCIKWEEAAQEANNFLRTVIFRFGVVWGKEDGVFPKFAKPTSLGVLPILGSGKQLMSWIHADDLCRMMIYALQNEEVKGVYNAVTPEPISQRELVRLIGQAKGGMKIPVRVPKMALKAMVGELSQEALKSCTVSAKKILDTGFRFEYDTAEKAVKDILGNHPSKHSR